jgi:hypothetical protein
VGLVGQFLGSRDDRQAADPGTRVANATSMNETKVVIIGGGLAGLCGWLLRTREWFCVEPGSVVPMAIMSGRHVNEILCSHLRRPFVSEPSARVPMINQ